MSRSNRRVYPPGKLPLQHPLFVEEDPPNDEKSRWATAPPNSGGFESPVIAVPFKWELEPGVPKQKLDRQEHQQRWRRDEEELLAKKSPPPPTADRATVVEKDLQQSDHPGKASPSPSPSPSSSSSSSSSSLAPPPRLMVISSSTGRKAGPALSSPRSPRSISLSRKMKSLLQGKLASPRKIFSEQQQQQRSSLWECESGKVVQELDRRVEEELVDRRCCVSRCCSSNDIVFEGELLDLHHQPKHPPPPAPAGSMPFKNMSSMLLELWYGGGGSSSEFPRSPIPGFFRDEFPLQSSGGSSTASSSEFPIQSSGSSTASSSKSIASPVTSSSSSPSDLESPGSSTDNSLGSFSSSDSSSHHDHHHQILHVPRHDHEFQTSFDSCDEVKLFGYASDDDEYGGGFDFAAAASREFFAKNFYYHSDRFRVESCDSPSLLGVKQLARSAVPVPPLPSALKSGKNSKKCLKKVRFACVEEEVEPEKAEDGPEVDEEEDDELVVASPSPTSPALSRFSSRPASRFCSIEEDDDGGFYRDSDELSSEPCSPSPRCARRDPSQLLLRIIQADAESSRKNKGALKSMFGSRSRW
ncbi:hypothetical protein SELMODRAFT_418668 [Selaginella moellendorffii]|uniref:Uncharacterized protein n=1 Tax=Selaginella moellendorffii TaxID=88036 RepID=D8S6S3_SELML|nr:uncharacterized protein LOC9659295 [Selaginella moellendorffii]EFJ19858.1 hypothetical protein SELMODRAFT_418668 [Selaginella moellendorffii]|eukprot:XP_002978901.1 uncharacterized protein LOC9659295 [Selaginella moellendorffii]